MRIMNNLKKLQTKSEALSEGNVEIKDCHKERLSDKRCCADASNDKFLSNFFNSFSLSRLQKLETSATGDKGQLSY